MLRLICPICQLAFERDKIESHIEEQHMDVVESQTETIEANDQSNEEFEEAFEPIVEIETKDEPFETNDIIEQKPKKYRMSKKAKKRQKVKEENVTMEFQEPFEPVVKIETKDEPFETNDTYDCEICSKSLSSARGLENHMKIVHQSRRLPCEFCGKQVIEARFQDHVTNCEIMHFKKYDGHPFQCDKCKRSFSRKSHLLEHQNIHVKVKEEKIDEKSGNICDICDKTLPSSLWLAKHMEIVHQSHLKNLEEMLKLEEKSTYECDKCCKTLSSIHFLERHMEIVHQSPKISCEFCGKQVIETMFQKHSVICEIVYYKKYSGHAFQCQNCKRSFKSDIELTRHQNVHSSIRFNCEFCDATFSTNHNKNAHMVKFHDVPKTTQKRIAEETVENLEKKPRISTVPDPSFDCDICQLSFKTNISFKRHQNINHKNEYQWVEI